MRHFANARRNKMIQLIVRRLRYVSLALMALMLVMGSILVCTTVASAQPRDAVFVGIGNRLTIYSRYYSGNVHAAVIRMNVEGSIYESYCVNLYTRIRIGDVLAVNGPLSEDPRTDIDWCAVNYILNTYHYSSAANPNLEAAAIQAAVWYFVTEPYGVYPGTPGPRYQFMSDPMSGNYDARDPHLANPAAVRERAFQIINSVPRDGAGECAFSFPVDITLEPESDTIFGPLPKSENLTATVYDQRGQRMQGVTVQFQTDNGSLNTSSGVTDTNGEVDVTLTTTASDDSAVVGTWVDGDYGTLLYHESGQLQSITTMTLIPGTIEDESEIFWTQEEAQPCIHMDKVHLTPGTIHYGDNITYEFHITNCGDVDLTNVTVTDPLFDNPPDTWRHVIGNLTVGNWTAFTEDYVIPDDADNPLVNTANVTGLYDSTQVSSSDSSNANITGFDKTGVVHLDVDKDLELCMEEKGGICLAMEPLFEDVTVELWTRPDPPGVPVLLATNLTDEYGSYLFTDIAPGPYTVKVPRHTGAHDQNEELYDRYVGVVTSISFDITSQGGHETGNNFIFQEREGPTSSVPALSHAGIAALIAALALAMLLAMRRGQARHIEQR
jgi:hypothetical protein